jgi:adenylyltransferase/sulfurtransferase
MSGIAGTDIEEEIIQLKRRVAELEVLRESGAGERTAGLLQNSVAPPTSAAAPWDNTVSHGLSKDIVERFSRQIILPSFGIESQSKLHNGSVLVIGAGGLGSPALLYLAAAGVGRIGIVDRDSVELSNIHRQIIHEESSVGMQKTSSAKAALLQLNSKLHIDEHMDGFTPTNAMKLVDEYDVVLDASDNAPTRYLISDACCVANKPLVSGAAIGTDGQLTVYHHGNDGPCYRCLYPTPPPAASCARCADAGVLGPVPGMIGTMQALEVIKILSGIGEVFSKKMLVVDALYCRYMVVKLRSRSVDCVSCGEEPAITRDTLPCFDYMAFTGQPPSDAPTSLSLVNDSERITVFQLAERMGTNSQSGVTCSDVKDHLLVDVRPKHQFDICSIPGAVNIPMTSFDPEKVKDIVQKGEYSSLSVICRRGNQSQRALLKLKSVGLEDAVDVIGGMQAWSEGVDDSCPIY